MELRGFIDLHLVTTVEYPDTCRMSGVLPSLRAPRGPSADNGPCPSGLIFWWSILDTIYVSAAPPVGLGFKGLTLSIGG